MHKALLILLIVLFAISCKQKDRTTLFYRDIDMFSLRGKNELLRDELQYPYIRIDSLSADERRVTYLYRATDTSSVTYRKTMLGWTSITNVDDPLFYKTYYEIIPGNGTVLYLEYCENTDPMDTVLLKVSDSTVLTSVRILTASTDNEYWLSWARKIHLKPTVDTSAYPAATAFRVVRTKYAFSGGKLNFVSSTCMRNAHQKIEECLPYNSCYEVGQLSYAWVEQFHHRMDSCR